MNQLLLQKMFILLKNTQAYTEGSGTSEIQVADDCFRRSIQLHLPAFLPRRKTQSLKQDKQRIEVLTTFSRFCIYLCDRVMQMKFSRPFFVKKMTSEPEKKNNSNLGTKSQIFDWSTCCRINHYSVWLNYHFNSCSIVRSNCIVYLFHFSLYVHKE